ncbi:MAG: succinate-semialdehyde dehydrogenase/glutarate-semialdehyde dehydrogenase [Maribacter sp.]|jgi:succinate-semialdehyde dehydrogenase/glutarate-semialdehyde dehydrogenase
MFKAINPSNGKLIRSLEFDDDTTITSKLELSEKAFQIWRKVPLNERAELMAEAGKVLLSAKEEYARLMVEEMGKTITAARSEIDKCALVCDYYAQNGEQFLEAKMVNTSASKSYVSYQPMGVILAVMPWNFPFWQIFRFAAPNIVAGNITLLKHAPCVPGCAVAIDDIFFKAGFPEDVLVPLYIDIDKMERVVADPIIKGVTLTGSTRAGKSIGALAGKYIKKSVLELGGSDPFIILADADIEKAAKICAKSRLKNVGQSCIGAKRIIVLNEVYEDFMEAFVPAFLSAKIGDPSLEETDLGPMAREDLRDALHEKVKASVNAGATCLIGGEKPKKNGAWYPITILTEVKKGNPAYKEEFFGPVATIIRAKDEVEALEIANDTTYGLGAAIFTADKKKGERIAREELNAGACFVNELVKSDHRLPFGGFKNSGYGRELSSFGMHEFLNIKTVWVD